MDTVQIRDPLWWFKACELCLQTAITPVAAGLPLTDRPRPLIRIYPPCLGGHFPNMYHVLVLKRAMLHGPNMYTKTILWQYRRILLVSLMSPLPLDCPSVTVRKLFLFQNQCAAFKRTVSAVQMMPVRGLFYTKAYSCQTVPMAVRHPTERTGHGSPPP